MLSRAVEAFEEIVYYLSSWDDVMFMISVTMFGKI